MSWEQLQGDLTNGAERCNLISYMVHNPPCCVFALGCEYNSNRIELTWTDNLFGQLENIDYQLTACPCYLFI